MAKTNLKILGIIGARSGSKSIPDKNIKLLSGQPLMSWIVSAARSSKYINRLIVSTDSEKYAAIGRKFGAETPFLRPAEIAGDKATDFQYVSHALDWLKENENYVPDIVVRLMPTVPLQKSEDIDACVENLIADPSAHSSVVVAEAGQHPHKAMKIVVDAGKDYLVGYFTGHPKDVEPTFRQGYEKAYFRANVVASRVWVVNNLKSLVGEKARCHVISQERAIDIDSPVDFFLAEKLMEYYSDKKS